jgi:hypothetical protein
VDYKLGKTVLTCFKTQSLNFLKEENTKNLSLDIRSPGRDFNQNTVQECTHSTAALGTEPICTAEFETKIQSVPKCLYSL